MPRKSGAILPYGKPGDELPADVRRNARRRTLRIAVWAPLLAVLLLALAYEVLWQRQRREYFNRFDRGALVGMTPGEVTTRFGRPLSAAGAPSTAGNWVYQRGMDPDAVIHWRNGAVVDVELLKYGGKP
jgi:hypothetical protein